MFSIKHMHAHGETIFEGSEPSFHKDMAGSEGATASYLNAQGVRIYITGGTVFVMNEAGKTVARYDLDLS